MIKKTNRKLTRVLRHRKLRQRVSGTTERPRLAIYRSNKHIYAQIIDDVRAVTIAAASTLDKELQTKVKKTWDCDGAKLVGNLIARRAKSAGIDTVVFDRGGNIYHGRIAAVAEGARETGLEF